MKVTAAPQPNGRLLRHSLGYVVAHARFGSPGHSKAFSDFPQGVSIKKRIDKEFVLRSTITYANSRDTVKVMIMPATIFMASWNPNP